MTFPLMADDIAHFIDKKKLENLFILGYSMGGKTLMTLLCKHPELYPRIKGVEIIILFELKKKNFFLFFCFFYLFYFFFFQL